MYTRIYPDGRRVAIMNGEASGGFMSTEPPDGKARLKTCRHRLRSVKRDGQFLYRQVQVLT